MPDNIIFPCGILDAAKYLNKSVASLKYHVHVAKTIEPRLIGRSLIFTQEQLDHFAENQRPPGRPPKSS